MPKFLIRDAYHEGSFLDAYYDLTFLETLHHTVVFALIISTLKQISRRIKASMIHKYKGREPMLGDNSTISPLPIETLLGVSI
jgi:hypothetical protein